LLLLHELGLLLVKLFGSLDDLLLLLSETVIDLTLFLFFLEQADSLERSLTLHNEGTDLVQLFRCDLVLGVLLQVLVDALEELIDLTLLVDIHIG